MKIEPYRILILDRALCDEFDTWWYEEEHSYIAYDAAWKIKNYKRYTKVKYVNENLIIDKKIH